MISFIFTAPSANLTHDNDSDELGHVIQIRRIVSTLPIKRAVVANILGRFPRCIRPKSKTPPLPVDNPSKLCCSPRSAKPTAARSYTGLRHRRVNGAPGAPRTSYQEDIRRAAAVNDVVAIKLFSIYEV